MTVIRTEIALMIKNGCNGFQCFSLLHAFRRLLLFSTSSSSSSLESNTSNFTKYLVNSLGFSEEQSLSTSSKLVRFWKGQVPRKVTTFDFQINAELVVTYFKQTGLDHSQIRHVVTQDPRILFANVDKTLKPKINDLHELGLSGFDLVRVISKNPGLLLRPLSTAVEALRAALGSDVNVTSIIMQSSWNWARSAKSLIPNVALLESYGVPTDRIRKAVLHQPSAFTRSTESFGYILKRVEDKWGIPPYSGAFLYAVQLLGTKNEETIDSKCRVFKSFGWTDSDVQALIRLNPLCFKSSEARIKSLLEFLMNELGYEPAYLASNCCLFTCSLEKRLFPRHKVLEILKDKGLIRSDYQLRSAVVLSESNFLKKFIQPFEDHVPNLHQIHTSYLLNSSHVSQKQRRVISQACNSHSPR